ncbi:MAG: DUF2148 domain-containing protein [bacterium]
MARYDGKEAARESVLQVAKLCAAAAYKAPQLTSRLEIKTEIITAEDQEPIIEFFREIAPISPVMAFDYQTLKHFRENDDPLVILLIGAKLTSCELGWDCGACGFSTCAEFNKFAKANMGRGTLWSGPSCNWKVMDFAAACDYACAAAAQYRFDCRAMATVGAAASGVGYLPDCSAHIGIPIGPTGDMIYYSRKQNMKEFTYESHRECLLQSSPTHWMSFAGSTKPSIKDRDEWWLDPVYPKYEPLSGEEQQFVAGTLEKVARVSEKYAPKIASWYQEKQK